MFIACIERSVSMKNNKTVAQIADKLGINKLRVYRFIDKNSIAPTETIKGVNYYDKHAQALINKHFIDKKTAATVSDNDTSDTRNEKELEQLLREKTDRISFIEIQITEKDEQIKQLTKLLDQQQQLSLSDKNEVMMLKEKVREMESLMSPVTEKEEQKKNRWFNFWK